MNVCITGGLGFVGAKLSADLIRRGHSVSVIERNPGNKPAPPAGVTVIRADATKPGAWQDQLAAHDAVINLAGVSIFSRWSRHRKNEIYNSRIFITRNIAEALRRSKAKQAVLISASAVGFYGFHGDEIITESDIPGEDFLSRVCRDWEGEALKAAQGGVRVVIARLGVVLGDNGGALDLLKRIFRLRIGNRLGNGRQWFSWIHADDLVSAFLFMLNDGRISGPVNVTSPGPVTNRELTMRLNRALGTFPVIPPAPGFAIKILMGELGDFILKGQRVVPQALLDRGFAFRYPEIGPALDSLVRSNR